MPCKRIPNGGPWRVGVPPNDQMDSPLSVTEECDQWPLAEGPLGALDVDGLAGPLDAPPTVFVDLCSVGLAVRGALMGSFAVRFGPPAVAVEVEALVGDVVAHLSSEGPQKWVPLGPQVLKARAEATPTAVVGPPRGMSRCLKNPCGFDRELLVERHCSTEPFGEVQTRDRAHGHRHIGRTGPAALGLRGESQKDSPRVGGWVMLGGHGGPDEIQI